MMLLSFSVFANKKIEPPPPPNNKSNLDLPPPGIPIDGGLSYLLIAGAAYGVYIKIKRLKN